MSVSFAASAKTDSASGNSLRPPSRTLQKKSSVLELAKSLSPNQVSIIEQLFKEFDADHDGFLSRTELLEVLRSLNVFPSTSEFNALVEHIDKDRDNKISKREFVAGLEWIKKTIQLSREARAQHRLERSGSSQSKISDTETESADAEEEEEEDDDEDDESRHFDLVVELVKQMLENSAAAAVAHPQMSGVLTDVCRLETVRAVESMIGRKLISDEAEARFSAAQKAATKK